VQCPLRGRPGRLVSAVSARPSDRTRTGRSAPWAGSACSRATTCASALRGSRPAACPVSAAVSTARPSRVHRGVRAAAAAAAHRQVASPHPGRLDGHAVRLSIRYAHEPVRGRPGSDTRRTVSLPLGALGLAAPVRPVLRDTLNGDRSAYGRGDDSGLVRHADNHAQPDRPVTGFVSPPHARRFHAQSVAPLPHEGRVRLTLTMYRHRHRATATLPRSRGLCELVVE
jgi:hypothetical protein